MQIKKQTFDYSKCMYCGVATGDFYVCDSCSRKGEDPIYTAKELLEIYNGGPNYGE